MSTKTKSKNKKRVGRNLIRKDKSIPVNTAFKKDADFGNITTADIDFSPLNYRKHFSEEAAFVFLMP